MPATLTPQEFVNRWRNVAVNEKKGYQQHFLDLCALVGHKTPLEDRPRYTPTTTFETFPFPWPPGQEPPDDPRVQRLATRRANWSRCAMRGSTRPARPRRS